MWRNNNHSDDVLSDNDRNTNCSTFLNSLVLISSWSHSTSFRQHRNDDGDDVRTTHSIFIHYFSNVQKFSFYYATNNRWYAIRVPQLHSAEYHHQCLRHHVKKNVSFLFVFRLCFVLFNNFIHSHTNTHAHTDKYTQKFEQNRVFTDDFQICVEMQTHSSNCTVLCECMPWIEHNEILLEFFFTHAHASTHMPNKHRKTKLEEKTTHSKDLMMHLVCV